MHGFLIGTIEHFRNADVKFSRFCQHRWSRRELREEWWRWWWWWEREERSSNKGGRRWWGGDSGNGEGGRKVMGEYVGFIFFLGV